MNLLDVIERLIVNCMQAAESDLLKCSLICVSVQFQVIAIDAKALKIKYKKSSFLLDIQFGRRLICGPSTLDHEQNPRMGCMCYYCEKHWNSTGGRPCFKMPRCACLVCFNPRILGFVCDRGGGGGGGVQRGVG